MREARRVHGAIESCQRADTVIHVLLVADRAYGGEAMGVARKLTNETGGRAIDVHNEQDLMKAFDEISDELSSEYSLGYYPTNGKQDGTYRKIKIDMSDKDYKALTRKGYYAAGRQLAPFAQTASEGTPKYSSPL